MSVFLGILSTFFGPINIIGMPGEIDDGFGTPVCLNIDAFSKYPKHFSGVK